MGAGAGGVAEGEAEGACLVDGFDFAAAVADVTVDGERLVEGARASG